MTPPGSNNIFERKMLEKRDPLVYIVKLKNAFKMLYKGYIVTDEFCIYGNNFRAASAAMPATTLFHCRQK